MKKMSKNELLMYYDYQFCLNKVQLDGMGLQYCKNRDPEILRQSIYKSKGLSIQYFKTNELTNSDITKLAIMQDSYNIRFIKDQPIDLVKLSLNSGCLIRYIRNQNILNQTDLEGIISTYPANILWINNDLYNDKLYSIASKSNPTYLKYNRIDLNTQGIYYSNDDIKNILIKDVYCIRYFRNYDYNIRDYALSLDSGIIGYIPYSLCDKNVYLNCLNKSNTSGAEFQFFNPSLLSINDYFEVCKLALQLDDLNYMYIDRFAEFSSDQKSELYQIMKEPIKYIDIGDQTEDLINKSISYNRYNILYADIQKYPSTYDTYDSMF
jgi:hypothetical protein